MHWVDDVAVQLVARGGDHVIASGTSVSGQIHLGNAGDVIFADAVAQAVRDRGGRARVIWVADDVDPLRSLPEQLGEAFLQHLGKPVSELPSPGGDDGGFVPYFTGPFLQDLRSLGIEPQTFSGRRMYRDGTYTPAIVEALRQAPRIAEILQRISGTTKPPGWLPFDPICPRCGKITPTKSHEVVTDDSGQIIGVRYVCRGGVAGRKKMEGCGNEGVADLKSGKLTWRVEWAARWKLLGVTCEPFGKEHSAAGGSYDTSKVLSTEIFGYEPPVPVEYEHIQVGGQKMSKSLGNVVTLTQMLAVVPPEVVRFFFFRTRPNKHKDFDIRQNLLHLVDDYEHVERLYVHLDEPSPQEDVEELRRTYELSQLVAPPQIPVAMVQVPYRTLVTVGQIAPGPWPEVEEVLGRVLDLSRLTDADRLRGAHKLACVRGWLQRYAAQNVRFTLAAQWDPTLLAPLSAEQRALLKTLSLLLAGVPAEQWKADGLHEVVHVAIGESGLGASKGFGVAYQVLLGQGSGPRLGYFLESLGRPWVLQRLADAASAAS